MSAAVAATAAVAADFAFPTPILFGGGRVREVRARLEAIGVSRPLVITDEGLFNTPTFRKALAGAPPVHHVFSAIQSNPNDREVEAAVETYIGRRCDSVI